MWCSGTWFRGGLDNDGLVVTFNDLSGLFQPKWFCDQIDFLQLGTAGTLSTVIPTVILWFCPSCHTTALGCRKLSLKPTLLDTFSVLVSACPRHKHWGCEGVPGLCAPCPSLRASSCRHSSAIAAATCVLSSNTSPLNSGCYSGAGGKMRAGYVIKTEIIR